MVKILNPEYGEFGSKFDVENCKLRNGKLRVFVSYITSCYRNVCLLNVSDAREEGFNVTCRISQMRCSVGRVTEVKMMKLHVLVREEIFYFWCSTPRLTFGIRIAISASLRQFSVLVEERISELDEITI